ncbi:MAG: hypothetical protein ACYTG3_16675 [Planctomycetota bacterium]|jgi:hypothetical protein
MATIDEACRRLARNTALLNGEIESQLAHVRQSLERGGDSVTRASAAELEFEGVLRQLDEVNEAAGDCLAAIRDVYE